MASIYRYALVDRSNNSDTWGEWDDVNDAKYMARRHDCAVIEREYTYEDENLIWTPDGSSTWPPVNMEGQD